MAMNIVEKILARSGGLPSVAPGDFVVVNVDTTVLFDNNFSTLYWRDVLKVADPDRIVVAYDHRVPPPDKASAQAQVVGRNFVKRFGIKRFHDIGRDQGISHVVVADNAYALPGTVLVCSDTHTGSGGAFNCAARGVGGPDVMYAAIKAETWFRVYPTIRYDIVGELAPGVTGKDVFLYLANTHGDHAGHNIEFGGPGMSGLRIETRRTIATQCTELNAEFAIFEADDVVLDYVRKRNPAPFTPVDPDPDAAYAARRTLDLGKVEILVAKPDTLLNNAVPVSEVAGIAINQGFIGSCANGNLDDLEIAARVLTGPSRRGRRAPSGDTGLAGGLPRRRSRPATSRRFMEAGRWSPIRPAAPAAAATWACSAPTRPASPRARATTRAAWATRSARIYMGSPATVAASAVTGVITDPGEFLNGAAS